MPKADRPVLTLDPSSRRTGFAVMRSADSSGLIDAGSIRPVRERDPLTARISAMGSEVGELIDEHRPALVLIEISTLGRRTRHQGSVQLGMAAGVVLDRALVAVDLGTVQRVATIEANRWTGGRPKARRRRMIAAIYPRMAAVIMADSGGDIADALGLGLWWFGTQQADFVTANRNED